MTTAAQNFNELHAFNAIKNRNGETIVDYLNLQLSRKAVKSLALCLNDEHSLNTRFRLALRFANSAANGGDAGAAEAASDYRRRVHYHLSSVLGVDRADRVSSMIVRWANAN